MDTHTQKTQENPSKSVANNGSVKQSRNHLDFGFTDNRPEATAQRKLQGIINNSPQVKHLNAMQKMADTRVGANNISSTKPIQMGKWVKGKYVEDDELDKGELSDVFYSTWSYVETLDEKNGDPAQYSYPKQNLAPAWLIAWQAFEAQWDALHILWVASGRTDFSNYAKGQAIWNLKTALDGVGGSLKKGEKGAAKLPHVRHQEELNIDAFITRADVSFLVWSAMVLPTLATRGPFDGNQLTHTEVLILTSGKRPMPGWTVHPSDTGGFALHKPGPGHAQIDPKTGKKATFIYHVL